MSGEWPIEEVSGAAAEVLTREVDLSRRRLVVCRTTDAAVVLGSTQGEDSVDVAGAAASGIGVVRRRSGGGAVLVSPGEILWVEAVLPAGDPLWEEDLGRSFLWLGRAWASALATCGVPGAEVHAGPLIRTRWSPVVCFAGLGPGEVTVGGRKVVGLSQRRRRAGALFQCAALLAWDPLRMAALVSVAVPAERLDLMRDLSEAAGPVGADPEALLAALAAAL